MINVVNVSQYTTVDQMSCIMHSLNAILREAHLDEPANEFAAIEYLAVNTNAPSVGE